MTPDKKTMPPTEPQIAALYERYAHIIHHRARRIMGNEEAAQDAVQETFARVIRHWDQFRGESSPLTWMYRISTNWCLNQLRDQRGRADKHVHRRQDILGEEASWLVVDEDAERVRALLDSADDQTRRIVVHIFFDEMTRQETAALVGLSVPTVRKRLRGFLKTSRKTLGVAALVVLLITALP